MVTFSEWVASQGCSHEAIAERLGVTRSYVTQLVGGRKTPSLGVVRRIIEVSGGTLTADSLVHEFARN